LIDKIFYFLFQYTLQQCFTIGTLLEKDKVFVTYITFYIIDCTKFLLISYNCHIYFTMVRKKTILIPLAVWHDPPKVEF
jgi:hypothetical protein